MDNKALADLMKVELGKVTAAMNKLVIWLKTDKDLEHANNHSNDTAAQHEIVTQPITAPPKSISATVKTNGPKEPANESRERWRFIVEIGVAILIAAYTFVAAWQGFEAHSANGLTKKALAANRETMYNQLRPYAMAGKIELVGDIKGGKPFCGKIDVINYGQTPALRVEGCADVAILPNTQPITDDLPCPNPHGPTAMANVKTTGEHSVTNLGSNNGSLPFLLLTPTTSISNVEPNGGEVGIEKYIQIFMNGAMRLYVYGYVGYFDAIAPNIRHTTLFCGRWNFERSAFDVCEKHNAMN